MTIDDLVNAVNDGWGCAYAELARTGNGKWTARFQVVEVDGADHPLCEGMNPGDAMLDLVWFLRGKRIRHRGGHGNWVDVPKNLEVMWF